MSQHNDNMDNQTFIWVALVLIVLLVIPALYAAKAGYINDVLLSIGRLQLALFKPFSEEARIVSERITQLDPAALSWEQVQRILHYCGTWSRWPMAVVLVILLVITLVQNRTGNLVRCFNMDSLLKNNAESFACLKPVVGRGKYLLSPESYDSGLWKVARTPLQFAVEQKLLYDTLGNTILPNGILKNGLATTENKLYGLIYLDEEDSLEVLHKQLGSHFTGFDGLSTCRKAAAAAFLAYAGGDKKACLAILDAVSSSYKEADSTASCSILQNEKFIEHLATAWDKHKKILEETCLLRHAAFELPWFMALLTRARQKGVLASSQFLWLRPMDRSLWYALNQCGGRAAWAEGFAPWAHYMAEEWAGKSLMEPRLDDAFTSLRDALDAQGWLIPVLIHDITPVPVPKKNPSPIQGQITANIQKTANPDAMSAASQETNDVHDSLPDSGSTKDIVSQEKESTDDRGLHLSDSREATVIQNFASEDVTNENISSESLPDPEVSDIEPMPSIDMEDTDMVYAGAEEDFEDDCHNEPDNIIREVYRCHE